MGPASVNHPQPLPLPARADGGRQFPRQEAGRTLATRLRPKTEPAGETIRFCWQTLLILLAMEKRCAPLPISARFLRACSERGWPENPGEIAAVVGRYLLRDDEGLVLSQLYAETDSNPATGALSGEPEP